MQVEIKRIHREVGITMIYVTHDQTEAMTMSDRLAVFCNGRLEQVGSPLDVYNRPVNRFVAEFIGDGNFFAGRADPARPHWVELTGIGPMRVAQALPAGDVDLMIRPERLRPRAAGASAGDDNTFEMTVDDIINYGDSILVLGKTRGLPLRARLLAGRMGGEADLPPPGTTLRLAWAPQDAHVLARASAPSSEPASRGAPC